MSPMTVAMKIASRLQDSTGTPSGRGYAAMATPAPTTAAQRRRRDDEPDGEENGGPAGGGGEDAVAGLAVGGCVVNV